MTNHRDRIKYQIYNLSDASLPVGKGVILNIKILKNITCLTAVRNHYSKMLRVLCGSPAPYIGTG